MSRFIGASEVHARYEHLKFENQSIHAGVVDKGTIGLSCWSLAAGDSPLATASSAKTRTGSMAGPILSLAASKKVDDKRYVTST